MPFRKGASGNPTGRKPGTRCRATVLAEQLIEGQAEEVVQKCLQMALEGDSTAMRLVMERLVPPRRERATPLRLPDLGDMENLPVATRTVLEQVAAGELTTGQAADVGRVLELHRRNVELVELERRVAALEGAARE